MSQVSSSLELSQPATPMEQRAVAPSIGVVAWLAVASGGLLRLWLAFDDHSIYWPDEIYQSLEQAHRLTFGSGLIPWEFRDGARSWLMPGFIAGIWKLASMLGVSSSLHFILLARLLMVASSIATLWLVAGVSTRLGGARAGWVSAAALAMMPISVVFGYRAMTETLSTPFVILGVLYLLDGTQRKAMLAGIATTVATLLRYQNGIFSIAFVVWLVLQRRVRHAHAFIVASAVVACLGGILDWLTWGSPFHSLISYIEFNLVANGASSFGVERAWYYAESLWDSVGLPTAVWAAFAIAGAMRAPALALIPVAYLALHSAVPHKELRFISPSLPLFAVLVGLGADRAYCFFERRSAVWWAILAIGLAGTAWSLPTLSYGRLGQYRGTPRAARVVWNAEEDVNLLLAKAGERSDLCGLATLGTRAAFTGGYTYFHRSVPLVYGNRLCDAAPSVNYVLARKDLATMPVVPDGYAVVQERGSAALYRRDGECAPLPRPYDNLLEGAHDMGLRREQPVPAEDGHIRLDMIRHSGAFVSGWGNGEVIDCVRGRWAIGRRALLRLHVRASTAYSLDLRLRAYDGQPAQHVSIDVNGRVVYRNDLTAQPEDVHLDLARETIATGDNDITFEFAGVWRPGGDDRRELAAFIDSVELAPASDDFSIDVGNPLDRDHLLSGFSTDEAEEDVTFSWSDGTASEVTGTLLDPHAPHVLTIMAQAVSWLSPQKVRVSINEHPIGILEVPSDWTRRGMLVPMNSLRQGTNRVRFEYSGTAAPSARDPQSADTRQLAVRFDSIEIAPLGSDPVIDLGSPSANGVMLDGWSQDEKEGSRTVVWSVGNHSSVAVSLAGTDVQTIKVDARAYVPALPLRVIVALDEVPIGAFKPTDKWATHAVVLPADFASAGGSVLTFWYDRTVQPADYEAGSRDRREIAVQFDKLQFVRAASREATPTGSVPPLQ